MQNILVYAKNYIKGRWDTIEAFIWGMGIVAATVLPGYLSIPCVFSIDEEAFLNANAFIPFSYVFSACAVCFFIFTIQHIRPQKLNKLLQQFSLNKIFLYFIFWLLIVQFVNNFSDIGTKLWWIFFCRLTVFASLILAINIAFSVNKECLLKGILFGILSFYLFLLSYHLLPASIRRATGYIVITKPYVAIIFMVLLNLYGHKGNTNIRKILPFLMLFIFLLLFQRFIPGKRLSLLGTLFAIAILEIFLWRLIRWRFKPFFFIVLVVITSLFFYQKMWIPYTKKPHYYGRLNSFREHKEFYKKAISLKGFVFGAVKFSDIWNTIHNAPFELLMVSGIIGLGIWLSSFLYLLYLWIKSYTINLFIILLFMWLGFTTCATFAIGHYPYFTHMYMLMYFIEYYLKRECAKQISQQNPIPKGAII